MERLTKWCFCKGQEVLCYMLASGKSLCGKKLVTDRPFERPTHKSVNKGLLCPECKAKHIAMWAANTTPN